MHVLHFGFVSMWQPHTIRLWFINLLKALDTNKWVTCERWLLARCMCNFQRTVFFSLLLIHFSYFSYIRAFKISMVVAIIIRVELSVQYVHARAICSPYATILTFGIFHERYIRYTEKEYWPEMAHVRPDTQFLCIKEKRKLLLKPI